MPSAEFDQAYENMSKLAKSPSNDEQLELYGLAKIAKGEKLPSEKPGMFDMKGKAKYQAWEKLVNANVTPEQADKKYVEKFEELKGKYGYNG